MELWLVQIARGASPRWWLAIGAAGGIACESKYSALFFFVAVFVGLLATPPRRILRTRWALAGVGLGAVIIAPNFVWQAHFGFPMWELLEAGQHGKNIIVGPLIYLVQQVAITNLYLAPVWIIGLVWLLRSAAHRFLGYAYLAIIGEMIVLHGKHYYPADIYPILIAAGGVAIAGWTAGRRPVRVALVAYTAAFAIIITPVVLPVLDERHELAYLSSVIDRVYPVGRSLTKTEHGDAPSLGQDFADMHGWPELVTAVRRAYDALPAADRAQAVIYAVNYGQASALRFYAPDLPVISGHNQYWLWGYGRASGNVILELGGTCWKSDHAFAHASIVKRYDTTLPVMAWENHLTFLECRGLRTTMPALWAGSKNYS